MSLSSDFEKIIMDMANGRPLNMSRLRDCVAALRNLEKTQAILNPNLGSHLTNRSNPHQVSFGQILGKQVTHKIASGVITVTAPNISVVAETTAADLLDTINGTSEGEIIVIQRGGSYAVTIKDGTGNLNIAGDFAMDNIRDTMILLNRNGTELIELSRSNNA